jgi:hypothetical protein
MNLPSTMLVALIRTGVTTVRSIRNTASEEPRQAFWNRRDSVLHSLQGRALRVVLGIIRESRRPSLQGRVAYDARAAADLLDTMEHSELERL